MEIRASQFQLGILNDPTRFIVSPAARRVGKTVAGMLKLLSVVPDMGTSDNVVVVCRTYSQAKSVWLAGIQEFFPPEYIDKINLSDMSIKLVNGCMIYLRTGGENGSVDTLRGMSISYCVIDEFPFFRDPRYVWEDVVMPALADKRGGALIISSPNGKDYFYELYNKGVNPDEPLYSAHHADYTKAFLSENVTELAEQAKRTVDPVTYAREWLASFEGSGKNVYYGFSHQHNVMNVDNPAEGEVVRAGIDFNIGIMACVLWCKRGGQMHIFDEVFGATNTEDLCKLLQSRHPTTKIITYPDPTGSARKTSAAVGQTDFSIIRSHGMQILAKKNTTSIVDGVNSVNALLCNGDGEANLFIHPRCTNLIKSLDTLVWKEDATSAVYNNPDVSHFPDALRYPADYEFGLNRTKLTPVNIKGF